LNQASLTSQGTESQPLERVGFYSVLVNLLLLSLNVVMATLSGSLALAAEAFHNLADLTASVAVVIGLKLSKRRHREFPYGLHKVENIVAVVVAFAIFFTAYEIARQAVLAVDRDPLIRPWMLAGVVASGLLPFAFSIYEMRVGRANNSPSLIADAREFQAHVLSSGLVLAALVGQWSGLQLDRPAALLIVVWIVRAAWHTLVDAIRVLLDASLDRATLETAEQIIRRVPGVVEVKGVSGRNAGRYRFIEAEVTLRTHAFERAHQISEEIEAAVRGEIVHLERALIHVLPVQRTVRRIAVPLSVETGAVSDHFGTAPYFALDDIRTRDARIEEHRIVANPHAGEPRGRGLRVAQWLLENGVDVLITTDDIREKGPGYALKEAGVVVIVSHEPNLESALDALRRGTAAS
jgi:cation diffusion facilitator family transporter